MRSITPLSRSGATADNAVDTLAASSVAGAQSPGVAPVKRSPIFRGWVVLAGIFLMMTAGSGFAFYAQGVFLDALVEEQGFSVGLAGAGTGTFFFVSGVAGYFAGGLISRFDIRLVMTVGAIVAGSGIALMGQVRTGWQMFVVFIIFGGGYALAGLVPTTTLVTRWFHRRRSLALAIASTGLSMGGITILPVIARMVDEQSLVEVAPTLGIAYVAIVIPITWLLLRTSPERFGLRPDGDAPTAAQLAHTGPVELPGTPFAVAVTSGYFRILSFAFVLVMAAQVGALQHLFKLTKDQIDVGAANLALAVVTTTSIVARIAGGLAAMKFPLIRLASVLVVVQAIGIAIVGTASTLPVIIVGGVILGSAMGNLLMLHPLLLADAFGVRDYARIYGLGALLMVFGVGLGPFIVGVLRDMFDYRTAFLAMSVLAMLGLVVLRLAPTPPAVETGPRREPPAPQPVGPTIVLPAVQDR